MAIPERKRLTVNELMMTIEQDKKLYEIIDGEITMQAAPSVKHQRLVGRLYSTIGDFIKANKGKCEPFFAPTDVVIDDYNCVQPDVFVVCDPSKVNDERINGAPDLVIEVVSSNRSDDYVRKLVLYKDSGVREYWIIDPKYERTLVYDFANDNYPQIYSFSQPVSAGIWNNELSITISQLL
ncbi:MAG: Uma2 family endonuclease [Ruminococcus sp.]|nr:Uma2 family endonuclease [Ruminococcus sp.]